MPLFVQPVLRQIQQFLETEGILQTRDSVEVTQVKAQETAGVKAKPVPKAIWFYRGHKYVAS